MNRSLRIGVLLCLTLAGCTRCDPPGAMLDAGTLPPETHVGIGYHPDGGSHPDGGDRCIVGVADLHTHPAAHLAYAGRADGTGGVFWGDPGVRAARWGTIPAQGPCDPETHLRTGADQVQRATRALVFRNLAAASEFPHGPGGTGPGTDEYRSWPDARDVFHQLMHVEALRRAYEGGLRVLFASVTDNRTLSLLFRAPIFPGPVAFRADADLEAAELQIEWVHQLAAQNADWLQVVTSPAQARDAIRSGHLALVISLELDALTIEQVQYLHDRWGARHIIPIHLADNNVGGTAAFSSIFNAHSALVSVMLGAPDPRLISVQATEAYPFRFGWPERIGVGVANFDPMPVTRDTAARAGYLPLGSCGIEAPGVPYQLGHQNSLGILDTNYLRRLREMGMMVDVSHMSARSVAGTLSEYGRDFPVMSSHTGVSSPGERPHSERDLTHDQARELLLTGGVIGLGTSGVFGVLSEDGTTLSPPQVLVHARGGILHRFTAPDDEVCFSSVDSGCEALPELQAGPTAGERWSLEIRGAAPQDTNAGMQRFVRVEPCGPEEPAVERPLRCAEGTCTAAFEMERVRRITVGWREPAICRTVSSGSWAVNAFRANGAWFPQAPDGDPLPWFILTEDRPEFVLAELRCDSDDRRFGERPADPPRPTPQRAVLRVRVRSSKHGSGRSPDEHSDSANLLRGAGALYPRAEVCAELLTGSSVVPIFRGMGADEQRGLRGDCGGDGFSINRGATWGEGVSLAAYVVVESDISVDGVRIRLSSEDTRFSGWSIDEVLVEEVGDPVFLWAQQYRALLESQFRAGIGAPDVPHAFALGSDINGIVAQFPTTALRECRGADDRESCVRMPVPMQLVRATPSEAGELGYPLRFSERGLASIGMLPELFAILQHYRENEVLAALFLSAEATIQMWERAEGGSATRCGTR